MARTYAIANQKGGVGKSSCTYHLAAAFAAAGARVLVVDMDPQGNISQALAADPMHGDELTMADVIDPGENRKLRDVIVPSVFGGVDLAPGRTELTVADGHLTNETGREHRLREALEPLRSDYDVVLVDCPPSLGLLTINALTAADQVLVVTQAEQWSADGMAELRRTVDRVRRYLNSELGYAGALINSYRTGLSLHAAGAAEIEQYFTEGPVLQPYIKQSAAIPETIAAGTRLDQHPSTTARANADAFAGYARTLLGVTDDGQA